MSQNPSRFNLNNIIESFNQLSQYVDRGLERIAPYLQSLKNGFTQANKSAQKLGRSIQNMMQLDGLGDKIEQNVQKAMSKAKGFFAKGMSDLMKFLTPLAGGAMVSKAFTTYIDGAKELEEAAKKAGQTIQEYQASQGLATYTEQDIELSKEWTKSQEELAVSLESINAVIMRMVMPAVNTMAQGIKNFISFIQENENDVKAFFIILGVFALALGAKMALAFAPMIVVAAGIGAAIAGISYILSDFFTYLEGGESKLSAFWSMFGTGEEISANLAKTWEMLKAVGIALWETLQAVGMVFWDTIKSRVNAFFTAFGPLIENVKGIFSGLFTFLEGLFTFNFDMMGEGLLETFSNAFSGIINLAVGLFDFLWSGLEGIVDFVSSGVKKVASWFDFGLGFGGDDDKTDAAIGIPQADAIAVNTPNYNQSTQATTVENTQSTNINTITINTNATDANGIARHMYDAIGSQSRHTVMAANMGATK